MYHQIHTYSELKQQIHDDLRIQHPDWVGPNGESPMCDSYESRLIELLDTLPRRGSNESIAAPQRALEQGTGSSRLMEYDYVTGKDSQGENTLMGAARSMCVRRRTSKSRRRRQKTSKRLGASQPERIEYR